MRRPIVLLMLAHSNQRLSYDIRLVGRLSIRLGLFACTLTTTTYRIASTVDACVCVCVHGMVQHSFSIFLFVILSLCCFYPLLIHLLFASSLRRFKQHTNTHSHTHGPIQTNGPTKRQQQLQTQKCRPAFKTNSVVIHALFHIILPNIYPKCTISHGLCVRAMCIQ